MYKFSGVYPKTVIFTIDRSRAKILAAHHLEYARVCREDDGLTAAHGSYNGAPIALVSSVPEGMPEFLLWAEQRGAEEIIYIGASDTRDYPPGTVMVCGDAEASARTLSAAKQLAIPVTVPGTVPDGFSGALFEQARKTGLAALAVLTVSDGTETARGILYPAARLVFETVVM